MDIFFTVKIDDQDEKYREKLINTIIEIVIFTSFIIFVAYCIIKQRRFLLSLISYTYLILGLMFFCFILIHVLKDTDAGSSSSCSRTTEYYDLHIDKALLVLAIAGGVFRIFSIVFLFLLAHTLNKMEDLLKSNLCENIISGDNRKTSDEVNKKDTINFTHHTCESTEKETESMEKEKSAHSYNEDYLGNHLDRRLSENTGLENQAQRTYSLGKNFPTEYYKKILIK
jgi:hypothetical protein